MDISLSTSQVIVLIAAALWELAWKGAALWKASRNNQLNWFIAILVINSIGLLPILYLTFMNGGDSNEGD